MSQPIHAPRRFSLLTAFGIMLGVIAAESLAGWLVDHAYTVGIFFGLFVGAGDNPMIDASLTIVTKLIAFTAVTRFVLRGSRENWRSLGHIRFSPVALVVGFIPIVAGTTIFLSEIDNLLRAILPEFLLNNWDLAPSLERLVEAAWLGPILAVVIAPLTEEVVFRGLILRGLLGRWRPWAAILTSAVLFSAMHFNPAQIPVSLGLGIVLGWVYARTRSLGLCVLGHAINNSSTYLPENLPFEVDGFNRVSDVAEVVFHPWWFDATGIGLVAAGLWLIHQLAPARTSWIVTVRSDPPLLIPPLLNGKTGGIGDCQPAPAAKTDPSMSDELDQLVTSLAQRARAASHALATAPTAKKDAALAKLADLIDASHEVLLAANLQDLASPEAIALSPASRDRLTLSEQRLRQLAVSVREVIALPDPVGTILDDTTRPNGLRIRKIRVPIGVIGIIYEARPNVTIDCAILCLKSGNASILRGGKECFQTNTALAALIGQALVAADLPADAVQLVPTTDRAALNTLLKLDTLIHCIIPRGGESLIRYVAENSTIPVIKHFKGVCFVYVDAAADLAMAEAITLNAKVQRPSACNAAEQLLVHRDVAEKFLPSVARALVAKGVQLRCDAASAEILAVAGVATTAATVGDFTAEFLDYIIAVRVVDSLEAAIATINRDSSNHSDAIVTAHEATAKRFLAEIDSATVYWNASTRFTDGFEFGYGAEIGISTDRLHARGPMGLPELCSYKFIIEGNGQVRG
ncbi:MAG: glutamate-5-semialdehyde dehydrogenase [Opitutus sp.]|nr:glutamate-5-semialdehyde dehydrogenase [Opitutus sp.]